MKSDNPRRMTHKRVGSYYNKLTKYLTDSFYQKIIELENEVQLPNTLLWIQLRN